MSDSTMAHVEFTDEFYIMFAPVLVSWSRALSPMHWVSQKVHLSFSTMLWENLNEPFGQFIHSMQLHISEEHTRNRIQARELDGCGIGFGGRFIFYYICSCPF